MSALRRPSASLPAGGFALSRFLGPAQPSQKRLAKSKAGNPDAIGYNITPQPGAPAHERNTVHPRSGQDLLRRATRRLQALRKPNPHPARNGRQNCDRLLRGEGHGCPIPTLRLRERLQSVFDNSVHVAIRLSVRQIVAMRIHASEVSARLSQSLLILRYLPSQAGVRSTARRLARILNPRSPFGRFTISSAQPATSFTQSTGFPRVSSVRPLGFVLDFGWLTWLQPSDSRFRGNDGGGLAGVGSSVRTRASARDTLILAFSRKGRRDPLTAICTWFRIADLVRLSPRPLGSYVARTTKSQTYPCKRGGGAAPYLGFTRTLAATS